MRNDNLQRSIRYRAQRGFTMIEVTLSVAIIAFALIAILGVLPSGLQVQKQNREDTIINQDGSYFMELIRYGAQGAINLEQHVESIEIARAGRTNRITPDNSSGNWNATRIIGLLSTPLEYPNRDPVRSVKAQVRAISGSLSDQSENAEITAFRYRITSEIRPYRGYTYQNLRMVQNMGQSDQGRRELRRLDALTKNLYEIRLTFQWPILPGGNVGNQKRTFSTVVAGNLARTDSDLYFFRPSSYKSGTSG